MTQSLDHEGSPSLPGLFYLTPRTWKFYVETNSEHTSPLKVDMGLGVMTSNV
jgi:hypothetical protein